MKSPDRFHLFTTILLLLLFCPMGLNGAETDVPAVIFDTDMGSDCDDAGALAVLHSLADAGEVKILGVVFSSGKNRYGVRTCDAINTYYGRGDLPLGQYHGTDVGDHHRLLPFTPESNPVREAYRLWGNGTAITEGRSSSDQVAVLFVIRPELFTIEDFGSVERKSDGQVVWNPRVDRANHHLVLPRLRPDEMAGLIEEMMSRPPGVSVLNGRN